MWDGAIEALGELYVGPLCATFATSCESIIILKLKVEKKRIAK